MNGRKESYMMNLAMVEKSLTNLAQSISFLISFHTTSDERVEIHQPNIVNDIMERDQKVAACSSDTHTHIEKEKKQHERTVR